MIHMTRALVLATFIIVPVVLLLGRPAHSYSCAQVRAAYQAYGAAQLWRWAREYRASRSQIRAGMACIRSGR